jgi:hypothetical protein
MRVVVSDTSVLVDLERGELLESVFGVSFELAVPDLLFRRELEGEIGERLVQLGLKVLELDEEGVTLALDYRNRDSKLSLPDTFALALAKTRGFVLLTGDASLRDLSAAEQVECHGVLWVLDRMFSEETVSTRTLHEGLTAIAAHPRCRLPKPEIAARLKKYSRKGNPTDEL